ncbi:hypothetical protein ES703_02873 [subsurface metagenome]
MVEKSLEHEFKESFGRSLEKPAEQEVLDSGDQECKHSRIFYIDNSFDGQAWRCDDCSRHERMGYSPGFIMKFPVKALISTPNPKYGGKDFYAFRVNDEGKAEELGERIKRK